MPDPTIHAWNSRFIITVYFHTRILLHNAFLYDLLINTMLLHDGFPQ